MLAEHAVAVRDGKIEAVLPAASAEARFGDYERVVLEVINDGRAGRAEDFNPYAQRVPRARDSTGATTRTDLRKLSDWIKKMRELEERKRNADDQDED